MSWLHESVIAKLLQPFGLWLLLRLQQPLRLGLAMRLPWIVCSPVVRKALPQRAFSIQYSELVLPEGLGGVGGGGPSEVAN